MLLIIGNASSRGFRTSNKKKNRKITDFTNQKYHSPAKPYCTAKKKCIGRLYYLSSLETLNVCSENNL